jgi:hypothetical protein
VIGKVLRGRHPAGLIRYLYGPGRDEEHTDPHIVAGWRPPGELEPPFRPDGSRDFRMLTGLLQQPVTALGSRAPDRPVWHCVVRAAPEDRLLSDADWAQVAAGVLHRTGLAPEGQEDDAVRWVAIRHADDHVHIVATLARQDGGKARTSNDFYRVREACLAAEEQFGLRKTAPADRTAGACPTRGETEKAQRHGRAEPPRVMLRRHVSTAAGGAGTEEEFFARLGDAGVLVRERSSTANPGQVTGYAVGLPGDETWAGQQVWYSGGKLAADLTLPKLRHRWQATPAAASPPRSGGLTARERAAIWDHAGRVCADAAGQIRSCLANGQTAAAADAAWAAADTLHVAASALGSRVIGQAAACYARAARVPYGRLPSPARSGHRLRRAGRLLARTACRTGDRDLRQVALVVRLAALAEAVSELRQAQHHAAQAAAALAAAERLRSAASQMSRSPGPDPVQSRGVTVLPPVFPFAGQPGRPGRSAHTRKQPRTARPQPRPGPPRRGPPHWAR